MERRVKLVLMALLILLFLQASTSLVALTNAQAERSETLIADICGGRAPAPFDCWNPFIPGNKRDQGYHELCMEPLYIVNLHTGEVIPWLATGHEYSPDFKKITVHLREGVKWNDGEPFTADDVVFTYEMLLEYAPKLGYSASVKSWVESITKIDDYTFEITLTAPNPRFHIFQAAFPVVRIWGGMPIVPKHIWEKEDPTKFKNYPPVGTGPYTLVSASETVFVWERRDDWWGTELFHVRPAPKRVVFTAPGPMETKAMLMAAHELDVVFMLLPEVFLEAKAKNPYIMSWFKDKPWAWVDPCPRHLYLNLAKYPYNITEVRRAISYMVDREEICEIGLEGGTVPTWGPFPYYGGLKPYFDAVADLIEKYEPTKYDPDKAEEILTGLGFKKGTDGIWIMPNGERWTMEVIARDWDPDSVAGTPILAEQLKKGGIDTTWKTMLSAPYSEELDYGYFEAIWMVCCPGDTDPLQVLEQYTSKYYKPIGEYGSPNQIRHADPKYDALIDELARTSPADLEKCKEIFRGIMDIYLGDVVTVPLVQAMINDADDTYYWVGWPSEDDPWIHSCCWWQSFNPVVCGYPSPLAGGEWVRGLMPKEIPDTVVYFTKDTPKFRGINLVWYGPFKSGDAERIPVDDAEYWIRMGYASYKAPPPVIPTIPTEKIDAIASDVSAVKADVSSVKADVTSLSDKAGALAGQMGTLTAAAAIEGIAIIVLAVALIVVRRK